MIKVSTKDLRWLTERAFFTKKRETIVEFTNTVSFFNTFWDGGSKNTYKCVKLLDCSTAALETGSSPWGAMAEGKTVELLPGYAIVEESIFCGKLMSLRVYLHPDNVASGLLPSANG